jgi:hypothetical protein
VKGLVVAAVRLTSRQLLFPLVLWWHYREPVEKRGEFLEAFHFYNPTEDSLELHFARSSGRKYGSLRLEAKPPRLILARKDGLRIEHDFSKDAASMEITKSRCLILHRENLPPFVLCRCMGHHAIQFIAVWNRLPEEIRTRLRIPSVEESTQ